MPELSPPGAVRRALSNERPYRDRFKTKVIVSVPLEYDRTVSEILIDFRKGRRVHR